MKKKNHLHFFPFKAARPALVAAGLFVTTLTPNSAATPAVDPSAAAHAAHVAAGSMPADATAPTNAAPLDPALAQQFSELQAKMARLEAALAKVAPPVAPAPAGTAMAGMPNAAPASSMGMAKMKASGKMGSMAAASSAPAPAMPGMAMPASAAPPAGAMGMMGMMDKMMGMMDQMMPMDPASPMKGAAMAPGSMPSAVAPMPAAGMGMMTMDKMEMAGMMGMAPMTGAAPDTMPQSALPGFPGSSHLYHIGATGFFLDHPQHITLSAEQTAALNQAKEQALLAKSTADRAIGQAEQDLWMLTSSDQPDAAKIESKIRQTEKLTGDARLAFIRAVGDASKLLTEEQRKILTGFASPVPTTTTADVPTPMPPMKGM